MRKDAVTDLLQPSLFLRIVKVTNYVVPYVPRNPINTLASQSEKIRQKPSALRLSFKNFKVLSSDVLNLSEASEFLLNDIVNPSDS